MRSRFSFITLVLGLASVGCHSSGWEARVVGEGPVTQSERAVTPFDRISLSGGMTLQVRAGQAERVVIHAEENLHEYIRSKVEDGELKIWIEGSISTKQGLVAEIDVPSLRAIGIAGGCTLNVSGLEGDEFSLDVSGSAKGNFAGSVQHLNIDVAGSSDLDLFELEAQDVSIEISGSGKIKTTARERLNVDIAGSGNVIYRGKPNVTLDQAGSAKVVAES